MEDELQSMEKGKLIRIFALSRNMADRPEGTRQHFGDRGEGRGSMRREEGRTGRQAGPLNGRSRR